MKTSPAACLHADRRHAGHRDGRHGEAHRHAHRRQRGAGRRSRRHRTFVVEIDPDKGDFCYTITSAKIAAPTMAHVHRGAAGPTARPSSRSIPRAATKCIAVEPDALKPIIATPEGYYVNIHNAEFPGGAIRGQLALKK
jgi:hypothetical protein